METSRALMEKLDACSSREPRLLEVLARPLATASLSGENAVTLRFEAATPLDQKKLNSSASAMNGVSTNLTNGSSSSPSTCAFHAPRDSDSDRGDQSAAPLPSHRASGRLTLGPSVSTTQTARVEVEGTTKTSSAPETLTQTLSQVSLVTIRRRSSGPGGCALRSRSGECSLATSRTASPRGEVPRLELHTSFLDASSRSSSSREHVHGASPLRTSPSLHLAGSATATDTAPILLQASPEPTYEALHIELPQQKTERLELRLVPTPPPALQPLAVVEIYNQPTRVSSQNPNAIESERHEEQELPTFTDQVYGYAPPAPTSQPTSPYTADMVFAHFPDSPERDSVFNAMEAQVEIDSVEGMVCELPDIEPTLWPAHPFDALEDALRLHRALSGTIFGSAMQSCGLKLGKKK